MDKDLYSLPPEELQKIEKTPASLEEAINALEEDNDFLKAGNVFTEDFLNMYIQWKRDELDQLRLRPHPYEFVLYFDI